MEDSSRTEPRLGGWEILALLVILGIPSLVWLDMPFWELPLGLLPQALLMPIAFAAASWVAEALGGRPMRRIVVGVLAFGAGMGLVYALGRGRPDVAFSRGVLGISTLLGVALFILGAVPSVRVRLAALVLGVGGAFMVGSGARAGLEASTAAGQTRVQLTSFYPLAVTRYDSVVALPDRRLGGGIAPLGDDFLGMTGTGALYRMSWDEVAADIVRRRIEISPPHNFATFDAAVAAVVDRSFFRTHDVATRRDGNGWELFVSHNHWNDAEQCVTLRVSRTRMDDALETMTDPWTVVFEARPCLPIGAEERGNAFAGAQSGGRLAWRGPDRLHLTIGDLEFDGWNREVAVPQAREYDYGKTFMIDLSTGEATLFTLGHRNPQGLYVAPDGRVWSTEHGPKGGDELNLLVEGGNYGWPWATYGTDYQRFEWPPAEAEHPREGFIEPVYAWTPAIGISNLIGIEGDRFPKWRGDLLVSSLTGQTLFRVRLVDGRVVLVEPIRIGMVIRDLIEGPKGQIWLWGDYGEVAVIDVAEALGRGETVFSACSGCHNAVTRSGGRGPSLWDVVGRRIASNGDFEYSPALRALDGRWTRERLDAFLANPGVFAPGTRMTYRLSDPEDRSAVIEYLERLPPPPGR